MPDRKREIAWLEQALRDIRDRHDLCECGRGPKRAETEICVFCELEAQAEIIDSDEMQAQPLE